jgi:hypothetical protein
MAVDYLTRHEAATYIRTHFGIPCSVHTLGKYAHFGTGPLYHRVGIVTRYDPADIARWAETRLTKPMRAAREFPLPGRKRGYQPSGLKNLRPAPERLEA